MSDSLAVHDFEILIEEGPFLVALKPGGVATQAPPGIDSLETRVKHFLKVRDNNPGRIYLGVPHRLDRPASGAIVLARHTQATRRLAEQFQGRTVRKCYWAVVQGELSPERGEWIDTVRKIPNVAQAEVVPPDHPDARTAVLRYHVLSVGNAVTWVQLELVTGRMHQIRLQFAHRGHPVLGDTLYGSAIQFGPQTEDVRRRWIALHARELSFRHPMTRAAVDSIAPVPEPWKDLEFWPAIKAMA